MADFTQYIEENKGKQVVVSTTKERISGLLLGTKTDGEGNINKLVLQKYFHRIDIPVEDILNVRAA